MGKRLDVAWIFTKLGLTGFGGPAALIAMMQEEIVERRRWLSREHFADLVGATNLIPGPNATEMAMHIGYIHAGWAGLFIAGICYVGPAATITSLLAWSYARFGTLPQLAPFLYGIKPAVLAVILAALWRLGRTTIKHKALLLLGLAAMSLCLAGINEVLALFSVAVTGMLVLRWRATRPKPHPPTAPALVGPALGAPLLALAEGVRAPVAFSFWKLVLFFLKTGAVLYGSGYVLVAFLQGGLVQRYGWLTEQQLLDAIAAGQFTPGPLLTTSTFIGYFLASVPGAILCTAAFILPSFLFVVLLNRAIPRLRRSPWSSAFLDAVNVSALGLMAAVTAKLALTTLVAWPPVLIAVVAIAMALLWKVNATWLVLGGAALGWVLHITGLVP